MEPQVLGSPYDITRAGKTREPEGGKEELITPRCCLKVKQESAKPAKPAVEHVNLN